MPTSWADDVSLIWREPAGRVTARPMAALNGEKAGVARARQAAKDLRAALSLKRGWVEAPFTEVRDWSVDDWRARHLAHPLTGTIGQRLIRRIRRDTTDVASVSVVDGRPVAADGTGVPIDDSDRVSLWHPIAADETEIGAWRSFLVERRIRQPVDDPTSRRMIPRHLRRMPPWILCDMTPWG